MSRYDRQNEKMIEETVSVHYAVQVCDTASYQNETRFCGPDRTLLSKKSIKSLILSIQECYRIKPMTKHHLLLIYDNTSDALLEYLKDIVQQYSDDNLKIELENLYPRTGITESIRYCYQWLTDTGIDFVFQVQDDYLFDKNAIIDSIEHFYVMLAENKTHAIIQPFNDIYHWTNQYRNQSTPRLVSPGKKDYWIQIYDTSCSFLTSQVQFKQHWDLYEKFFELIPTAGKGQSNLENISLNYMFTRKGVLGLAPIRTLSHHIQTVPDFYVDWKILWDSIEL